MGLPFPLLLRMGTSLRRRVQEVSPALPLALGVLFVLMLLGLQSYERSRDLLLKSEEKGQRAVMHSLGDALADHLVVLDYAAMEAHLRQAMADPDLAEALVTDTEGRVLVHLVRGRPGEPARLGFTPVRLPLPRTVASMAIPEPDGGRIRWHAVRAGPVVGWLRLRTAASATRRVLTVLAREYQILVGLTGLLLLILLGLTQSMLLQRARLRETKLQRENEELDRRASRDPLTGLSNRRGVDAALTGSLEALERGGGQHLAVCMIDLDNFKPVNDSFGHEVGDRLLVEVAQRLRRCLRRGDALARLGGDEFLCLLEPCRSVDLPVLLAERILRALSHPFVLGSITVRIGASVGIAYLDGSRRLTPAEVLHEADAAMYVAKGAGRSRWHLVALVRGVLPLDHPAAQLPG